MTPPTDISNDVHENAHYSADANAAFAKAFPHLVGTISTHYDGCHRSHPGCAWRLGWDAAMHAAPDPDAWRSRKTTSTNPLRDTANGRRTVREFMARVLIHQYRKAGR